jgi:hypothetical protein
MSLAYVHLMELSEFHAEELCYIRVEEQRDHETIVVRVYTKTDF